MTTSCVVMPRRPGPLKPVLTFGRRFHQERSSGTGLGKGNSKRIGANLLRLTTYAGVPAI